MTDTRPYQDPADAPGTLIRSLSRLEAYFTFGYGHFGGHSMLISGSWTSKLSTTPLSKYSSVTNPYEASSTRTGKFPSLWWDTSRPGRSVYSREKTCTPAPRDVRPHSIRRSSSSTSIYLRGGPRPRNFFCTMPLRTAATARRSSTNSGICMFSASRKGGLAGRHPKIRAIRRVLPEPHPVSRRGSNSESR